MSYQQVAERLTEGITMKTLKIDTLEMAYNEQNNEIRLLVNSHNSEATLFTLNASNLMNFMDEISRPETHEIILVAQPMVEQSEELHGFIYHLNNNDLSEHFNGETYPVSIFASAEDRVMIESELWALGTILDYVMS